MPTSYQPEWTSVIVRSFSTSRERHPAITSARIRHVVKRLLMAELYIALDRTPDGMPGSRSVLAALDLLAHFVECHPSGPIRRKVAALDAEDYRARVSG